MADRSIVVRLKAQVDGFKSAMADAKKATEQVADGAEQSSKKAGSAFDTLKKSATENRGAWDSVGTTMTGFGAATVGALGLATKAAMDWESSWAGVQKTVDGTAPQMEALESGLRGLARELPASHAEIAAVAEAAGQLGIATPNVLGFTRTMIDMGESTNLSAEEAATSLARFMNVMGTSQADVGRLGASVVGLGNNFATTESEIVEMSQRLAGAGAQAKLSEGDVMGIAAAMSSVGIEAEAGGSAMSQTMKRIGKSVDEGGESLSLFAQVSGMSAEQFSAAWKSDPALALDAFISGLSGVEAQGMTTNGVLTDLGITGIRESDALLRLSAASGRGAEGMSLLAEAVSLGNDEFGKGSALIEEASKRYETAESRIAIAKNALVDLGISVGGVVLPAIASLADGAGDLAGWFADLPAPVHQAAAGLGAVVGSTALAAGGFLLLFPRLMDTVTAFKDLNKSTKGMAGTVGKVGLAVGVAAAAFPVLVAGARAAEDALKGVDRAALDIGMAEMSARTMDAADSASAYNSILGDLAGSGALNTKQFTDLGDAVTDVANMDALGKLGVDMGLASGGMDLLIDRLAQTGEALAVLYQTDAPQAQESFKAIWAEVEAGGASFDELLETMPAFKEELQTMANLMGEDATDSAVLFRIATGEIVPVVDEATGAVTGFAEGADGAAEAMSGAAEEAAGLYDAMTSMADGFLNARSAARDYQESLTDAKKALDENGKAWGGNSEKAMENAEAMDAVSQSVLDNADAMKRNGEDVGGYLQDQRKVLWELAKDFGATDEEATAYVNSLGLIPDDIATVVELETQAALDEWDRIWTEKGIHPPQVPVDADTTPAENSKQLFEDSIVSSDPALAPVGADTSQAEEEVHVFGSQVGDVPTAPVPVTADIQPAQMDVINLENTIAASGGTVTINGNATPGDQVLDTLMAIINSSDGTVTIDGETYPADRALSAAITAINNGSGTVEIDGNNSGAKSATNDAVGHANSSSGTIDVDARTAGANAAINAAARNRTAYINVVATGATNMLRAGVAGIRRAAGGPVYGPGTGTSDSIPALLSNGEHVITAAEVARAGGQDAIYRMRAAINSGLKFANGGGVENGGYAPVRFAPQARTASVSASVDTAAIGAEMRAAMTGMQVAMKIDHRTVYGVVEDAGHAMRKPFVHKGA